MSCKDCQTVDPKTIECRHISRRHEHSNECGLLSRVLGFRCNVMAEDCIACQRERNHELPESQWTILNRLAKARLAARLRAGYLPQVQETNPFDLNAAFAKFASLSDKPEQEQLLKQMLDFQTKHGGLPFEGIATTIRALADEHGIPLAFDRAGLEEQHRAHQAEFRACRYRTQDGCCGHERISCPFHAQPLTPLICSECHVPGLDIPQPAEDAPTLLFALRPGYRERHTTFFLEPFAREGWRIEHVMMDLEKPLMGLPEKIRQVGIPDAVIQWEEHGVARAVRPWREFLEWCYDRNIVPLSVDFGYFGHYQHFMLDRYERNGFSSIHAEWDSVAEAAIDWQKLSFDLRDYHRRVSRGYREARQKPPLIQGKYVALWLQQYSTLCRLQPRGHHNDLVRRIAEELKKRGLKLAVKTAPSTPETDALTKWPDGVHVFRHEQVPNDTNQRLAVHAEYCLVISSSMTNEFLLNDLPVVALGRSWFQGHDVFCEPQSWADLPASAPAINREARNRYSNWWLSRQFRSCDAGPALTRIVHAAQKDTRQALKHPGTVITCIYAPDKQTEQMAAASLSHSLKALPDWKKIVPIDHAGALLTLAIASDKLTAFTIREGHPPRMGQLLRAAVTISEGEYIFSVEQDVLLKAEQAKKAIALMRRLPNRVAALYLKSVTANGRPEYPFTSDWPEAKPWAGHGDLRIPRWPTLSCTLWRRSALAHINWNRVPELEFVDGEIGNQLKHAGYVCVMTDAIQAVHLPHSARRCLHGSARTLAIGCRGNIWDRRGIRFGWNGAKDLDVWGPVLGALPFDADSFREIYVCGGMEKLNQNQREIFTYEAWRVLRNNGRLEFCMDIGPLAQELEKGFRVERVAPERTRAWAIKT